jgi:hypothetical protein
MQTIDAGGRLPGCEGMAQLNVAAKADRKQEPELAARLYQDAVRFDLPQFAACALVHQARSGDRSGVAHDAVTAADESGPGASTRGGGRTSPGRHRQRSATS